MSTGDEKPAEQPPAGVPGASPAKPDPRDGVKHDKRGNAVWQWAVDTGKHAIDSTSRLLKRLEVPGLSLEDDDKPGAKPGKQSGTGTGAPTSRGPAGPPSRSSGYDPYGRRTGRPNPLAPPPPPARKPGTTIRKPMTGSQPRRSWWQRLFRRR